MKVSKSPGIPHGDDFGTAQYSLVVFVLSCSVLSTLLGDFGPRRFAARGGFGRRGARLHVCGFWWLLHASGGVYAGQNR